MLFHHITEKRSVFELYAFVLYFDNITWTKIISIHYYIIDPNRTSIIIIIIIKPLT